MEEKNAKSLFEGLKLFVRAIKAAHTIERKFFPAMFSADILNALTPYVVIYFSSLILNELSSDKRPEYLWKLVILTVTISGGLSIVGAILKHMKTKYREVFLFNYRRLYINKAFDMDYEDVSNQETFDLLSKISQAENWAGWGFENVIRTFSGLTRSITGIIGAFSLTISLFFIKAPAGNPSLQFLNTPLFMLLFFALMIGLSVIAGKLVGYCDACSAKLAESATLGNRIFGYFGFFSRSKRDVDVRMYDQSRIMNYYFNNDEYNAFSINGPFAKLAKGKGGICIGTAQGLSAILTGCVYLFTCLKAIAGAFGIGSIMRYVGAATQFSLYMADFVTSVSDIRNNAPFLENCFKYLDKPNHMYKGSLTTEKRADRNYDVEFKDVSFKYPGTDTWALRHVNVRFKVGKRLAVVGENGSGKTTFIKLLCRLYDPQEGEILLNGIDIKKYDYKDYIDIFSVVFQDYVLMSQPIADNVAGTDKYDVKRVTKALNDAGFSERLSTMPNGINTLIYKNYGESGVELSGGEEQKVAIARALYKDGPFLILDEPTAALDPIAEADIYSHLNSIVGDRTAIYISHRLSSCRFCDEIMVFDKGEIVETGTHEELLENNRGKYYELWNVQAKHYVEAAG